MDVHIAVRKSARKGSAHISADVGGHAVATLPGLEDSKGVAVLSQAPAQFGSAKADSMWVRDALKVREAHRLANFLAYIDAKRGTSRRSEDRKGDQERHEAVHGAGGRTRSGATRHQSKIPRVPCGPADLASFVRKMVFLCAQKAQSDVHKGCSGNQNKRQKIVKKKRKERPQIHYDSLAQ